MAKRSSAPRTAYPEVNVQVRDLVRVVGIVAPFAPRGFSIRGKFVLLSPRGLMGTRDLCRVPPAAVHHGIGQAKSSMPALSYFQVGGMKNDELYAKVSYIPSCRSSMRRELYADL